MRSGFTHIMYVTRSDKRGRKSLGRAREKWRNDHLGVILWIYCFWYFDIAGRLFCHILTGHSPFQRSNYKWLGNTFQITKAYFHYSSVNPFSSIFSKCPLNYHLTLRGHNFTLALDTVLQLRSFQVTKAYFDNSSVTPFSSIFSKCPLNYHLS